jgi:hypothetical protein
MRNIYLTFHTTQISHKNLYRPVPLEWAVSTRILSLQKIGSQIKEFVKLLLFIIHCRNPLVFPFSLGYAKRQQSSIQCYALELKIIDIRPQLKSKFHTYMKLNLRK